MTEESAKPASSPSAESAAPPPAPENAAAPAAPAAGRTASRLSPWLLLGLVVVGLFAWQWFETRLRLVETQQELARRLAESDLAAKESRLLAKQAQDQVTALQTRLGELDARLAESQSQQAALENLYQDLARNRDEWALSEIEQGVTLAAQQLQLAGNVQGAVMALQAADARLGASPLPHYIGLRKAFGRDLDRLKAVPQIDLPGMSVRLESVVTAIDALPLAIDVRPRAESAPPTAAAPDAPAWQLALLDAWNEMKGLVRIQRFDRDEPVLLAPGQVFFLRENLKLRLLSARLAMLARDQWTFRNELKAAQALLERHFDVRDKSVQTAVGALRQLGGSELGIELPTLNESLSAIRSFRATREREPRGGRK
ncbi:MAG: uroporphyrinogen-III C-methyltransferase [Rhodocyclaceae bacterium]|nr:uroporphyrinogen-III C-methyltransferase [Rhodocyclaceae bacterium]